MKDGFGWDKFEEGLVLSAFFYGYGATQIVGGRWADRAGGKTTLGWGVAAWSAATALTPAAARAGIAPLIAMRVILGMGEGVAFPACHALIAREVPREKRSTAVAAVTAASYAGAAFAFAVTPGLVSEFGWPSAFYSFGAIALLWAPFWFALPDHREPRGDDDEIEDAETRRFIAESSATATNPPTSFAIWTELIRRKEVRAICVAQFTQSWGMYGLLSWLPTYFNEAQGVDLADLPAFTFAPYILQGVVGFGVGMIADDLIHNKKRARENGETRGAVRRHARPALCLLVAASPLDRRQRHARRRRRRPRSRALRPHARGRERLASRHRASTRRHGLRHRQHRRHARRRARRARQRRHPRRLRFLVLSLRRHRLRVRFSALFIGTSTSAIAS